MSGAPVRQLTHVAYLQSLPAQQLEEIVISMMGDAAYDSALMAGMIGQRSTEEIDPHEIAVSGVRMSKMASFSEEKPEQFITSLAKKIADHLWMKNKAPSRAKIRKFLKKTPDQEYT